MLTIEEIKKMSAKEVQAFIAKKEGEMLELSSKLAAVKNELTPFYHVRSIRTSTGDEKLRWEFELRTEK